MWNEFFIHDLIIQIIRFYDFRIFEYFENTTL